MPTDNNSNRPKNGNRPAGSRPSNGRPAGARPSSNRPSNGRPTSRTEGSRPSQGRPNGNRPTGARPSDGRPRSANGRPAGARPTSGRPTGSRPSNGRPTGARTPEGRRRYDDMYEEPYRMDSSRIKKSSKKAKNTKTLKVALILEIIVLAVLGLVFLKLKSHPKEKYADVTSINVVAPEMIQSADIKVPPKSTSATITMFGDVMMHSTQIKLAYNAGTDSFDVSPEFMYIKDYLGNGDYSFCNLETTLPGRNKGACKSILGYDGYPMFSSPEVLADALKDCGVDMVQTANNHCMDSWESGVYATIDYLDSIGLEHTGTFKTKEESEELFIKEINGITFGFVAYTYGTNGLPVSKDNPWSVNTLENYDDAHVEEMLSKIRQLDAAGVDFVCPIIHWGTEYLVEPDYYEKLLADKMFEAGADIIIGGHPHVAEPMEVRTIDNGDGTTRTGYVIYSFGNFVSCQTEKQAPTANLGLVIDMTFTKETSGSNVTKGVTDIEVCPTYVFIHSDNIAALPALEVKNNPGNFTFLNQYDMDRCNYSSTYMQDLICKYGTLKSTENGNYFKVEPVNGYVMDTVK